MTTINRPAKPCAECPWRRDVRPGRFPPERFAALAASAYDMNNMIFTCHKTSVDKPLACAGFLLRGAVHNFSIRMALAQRELDLAGVSDAGLPLFDCYRDMAVANGVDPDDPVLKPCRSA